jgi:uncharacterized membrane protein YphA (DoxX/SURF4 family)
MQRLYPTFPGRAPGLALLLLRAALGGTLLGFCARSVAVPDPGWRAVTAGILAGVSGLTMLIGVVTPVASVAAALVMVLIMVRSGDTSAGLLGGRAENLLLVVIATALALLGPGALSLDARLYGRREMSFPPRPARPPIHGEEPEEPGAGYHDRGSGP